MVAVEISWEKPGKWNKIKEIFSMENDVLEKHMQLVKELSEKPQVEKSLTLVDKKIELSAYRNERNLMLFPFCSTSKRKRLSSIEYKTVDGRRWLEVSASAKHGMAKIWDFDVLRFALSKAGEIARVDGCIFPPYVDFTACECLKAIGRNDSGASLIWFEEALVRLSTTAYRGNIFRENEKITSIFTLIEVDFLKKDGKIDRIRIKFNERLIESARYSRGLLEINSDVINEISGIKKRLLELVKTSKGTDPIWTVGLERLQAMCAHEGVLKGFKRELNSYQCLPWMVSFSPKIDGGENVSFTDV
jgi:Replication initiator protein A